MTMTIEEFLNELEEEEKKGKYAKATDKSDDGDGMDPPGEEDSDIDNDGDSDDSDEYLSNRRKAIKKAMKEAFESFEEEVELDELSKNTLGSYIKKAQNQKYANWHALGKEYQKRIDKGQGFDADPSMRRDPKFKRKIDQNIKREKGIDRAIDRLTKEEVELDESKTPLGDKWRNGVSPLKSGSLKLIRKASGVHSIMHNGKSLGDFSYDDEADNFVGNIKGMRSQLVANEIDDLIDQLKKHKEENLD